MANNTTIHLLNVPIESDYKNTFYFANKDEQINYFLSKKVKTAEECTYQRKDKTINFPGYYDELQICNYAMYRNLDYSSKWYFAFITDMEFVSDGTTKIHLETDCIQTWLFDYSIKSSFVEREHVTDDTIGLHTVPEQLETGDYICNKQIKNGSLRSKGFIIGATIDLADNDALGDETKETKFPTFAGGGMYNGIYSGVHYFYYPYDPESKNINRVLKLVAIKGQSDAICSLFTAPATWLETTSDGVGYSIKNTTEEKSYNWNPGIFGETQESIYKPSSINGHTPRNKKLLSYPFAYLLMSNNSGAGAIYKYELFKNPNDSSLCDFKINFAITPGCSIRSYPLYYNGVNDNNEEGLNLGKFPVCSWVNDVYTNWLTQNAVNIPLQIASSALTIAGGVGMMATGAGALAGAGSVASGLMGIASTVGEIYQHSLVPPQAEGNVNSGDVTFSQGDLTFTAYQMSIKAEYARIIDEFFDMFGYKVNRVKIPNKNHRSHYWYTKTIDVNIDGAIPNKDLQIIKNAYNNGITFWRSSASMNDYSVNNSII